MELTDPEAILYAGIATLGSVVNLALNDDLELLGASLPFILAGAEANIETGLETLPHQETRSLNGAIHVFEAHLGDFYSES